MLDKLNYKVEEIWDTIKIKFFLEWEYVGFAQYNIITKNRINLEEFLTSNYNTTFDKDLPEEMKEEYKLMDKVNISGLGTNILVKLFAYLIKKDFSEVELVSSKWSVWFYEKVFNKLEEDNFINWEIYDLPWENKDQYIIYLKGPLLDLDN